MGEKAFLRVERNVDIAGRDIVSHVKDVKIAELKKEISGVFP